MNSTIDDVGDQIIADKKQKTLHITSQNDDVAALERRIAELEKQLAAARDINATSADVMLTYEDLGISSEDIFDILESYTLTSAAIILTKEKLAKIIQHYIVRNINHRFRDARTFMDVLDLRMCKLQAGLKTLCDASSNHPDTATSLEIARLEISIRNLVHIREIIEMPTSRSSEQHA